MALHRVRGVFNVSGPAQAAAIAALADTGHTRKARAHNDRWLPWLASELEGLTVKVIPSIGNFLLLDFKDEAQCRSADGFLRGRGLILRPVANYGLGQYLRLSVGLEHENRAVIAALGDWTNSAA